MSRILFFLTCEDKTGIELALEHKDGNDQLSICLVKNAIYTANKNYTLIQNCIKNMKVYAIKECVEKRGFKNYIHKDVKLIDYGDVIDLILEQDNIINM